MSDLLNSGKRKLPYLGETLGVYLEVFGYRLERRTTIYSLGRDFFGTDDSGLRKRFIGQIGITATELSQLIVALELDKEGFYAEDFALHPEALRTKMKTLCVGIYGRQASIKLHRAVLDFEGPRGTLDIVPPDKRGSGFTTMPITQEDPKKWTLLRVNETFRFECRGPRDAQIYVLDHLSDGHDATLLYPQRSDDLRASSAHGTLIFPNVIDPPLRVRDLTGNRFVSALWIDPKVAAKLNSALSLSFDSDMHDAEFYTLNASHIEMLIKTLALGAEGPVKAVCTEIYRIEGS